MTLNIAAPVVAQPATPAPPAKRKRTYLHQADLFRIMTFCCVVGVHVVGRTTDPMSVSANGLLALLHFTRQAFFALTGFVLVYQYVGKPFRARTFWRRRFALIGIPYLLWSVGYWGYSIAAGIHQETFGQSLQRLAFEVATGGAWYQLYFLLVSMQVYLLFPLILRLLRATAGHHRWVLAVSAVLQAGCLWWLSHPPQLSGSAAGIWNHLFATVLPYQFYVMVGAVAGYHLDTLDKAVRRFGPWLITGAVLSVVFVEWDLVRSTNDGTPPWQASNVFLPQLLICYLLIIALLYTVSLWWAGGRRSDRFSSRAITYGSDRSFGVFLVHPLILELMMPVVPGLQHAFGVSWGTVVLYTGVLAGSLAATEVVRRIPGSSLWLVGRPALRTDLSALAGRFRGRPGRDELPSQATARHDTARHDTAEEKRCTPTH